MTFKFILGVGTWYSGITRTRWWWDVKTQRPCLFSSSLPASSWSHSSAPFFFFCAGAVCVHPSVRPPDVAEEEAAVVHHLWCHLRERQQDVKTAARLCEWPRPGSDWLKDRCQVSHFCDVTTGYIDPFPCLAGTRDLLNFRCRCAEEQEKSLHH